MFIMVALMVLMVGVILVGLKVIWKDSPRTPSSKSGHLSRRWPAPLTASATGSMIEGATP